MIDLDQNGGRIRFISDLHLGHPGSLLKSPEDFAFLLEGCDTLVVCGDFSEARPCAYQEEGARLRAVFEGMCVERNVRLATLCGNHDPSEPEAFATARKGKILALHGHQLYKKVAPWGREYLLHKKEAKKIMAQFPNAEGNLDSLLERTRAMSLFTPPVLRKKETAGSGLYDLFKNACWPPARPFNILFSWLTMRGKIDRFTKQFFPNAEIVCFGHLHRRDIFTRGGKVYINTGALFKHARAFSVDVTDGEIIVRNIEPDGWGGEAARFPLPS